MHSWPVRAGTALLLAVAIAVCTSGQSAQEPPAAPKNSSYTGISVAASPQLFATMCALDAAGFEADESTLAEMPARLALRDSLLKMQGPATDALRQFYHDHELADPADTLSRYITFALVAGPPPNFQFQVDHDLLPPDVLAIEGFQKVLADFYHEAHLDLRWTGVEPEYNRAIARYQSPVRRIVTIVNAYLREIFKPSNGRTFTVFVEPLVGNRTNFRNAGDNYAIVVGTGPDIPEDDIRHAYLHFMLDPLPLRYRKLVESKSPLLNVAGRAPQLPAEYRDDFLSFADECLIKAVELRIRHLTPQQLEAAITGADRSGFILVRPFVAQLMKFEKAEPAMSYYFPDLINGIDVAAEQKRLQNFAFAPAQTPAVGKQAAAGGPSSELDSLLAQGDKEIALQNAAAAASTFQNILSKYPNEPRAVYGLAIASVLSGEAEQAKVLFEQIVTPGASSTKDEGKSAATSDDPSILSWSHVYLGRIDDLEGQREQATREYRAALAVAGAPEAARVAAQRGVDSAYQPPSGAKENAPR
ncbi:MAG: tetratricopeptide repeat protein [Candidatus Acidiferrales bacterium]